jgi:hypothetical protein
VACSFLCVAFLSNTFSLAAAVDANAEIGYTGNRQLVERLVLAPSVGFSVDSRRNRLQLGYGTTLTEVIFPDSARFIQTHRLGISASRVLTPLTTLSLSALGITGQFDVASLQSELDPTSTIPTTGIVSYTNGSATAALTTTLSHRWSLDGSLSASYNDTPQIGTGVNLASYQYNLAAGLNYAWLARQSLQFSLSAGRLDRPAATLPAVDGGDPTPLPGAELLTASGQVSTGRALSPTSNASVGAGYNLTMDWPGSDGGGSSQAGRGASFFISYAKSVVGGANPLSLDFALNWSPTYDPFTDRTRARAGATLSANWLPAQDWSTSLSASFTTPTNDSALPPLSNGEPLTETRISFSTPVNFRISRLASLNFGTRVNLPAPHLSQRFRIIRPDYWGFAGLRLQTP